MYISNFPNVSHPLSPFLRGCVQKSWTAGQAGQGDRREDGAGATTDPGLRRDQAGPLAATDHPEERGHSQTVNLAHSPLLCPSALPHPKAFTEHLSLPDPPPCTAHWTVGKSMSPLQDHAVVAAVHSGVEAQLAWNSSATPPMKVSWTQTFCLLVLTIAVTCTDFPRLRHLL